MSIRPFAWMLIVASALAQGCSNHPLVEICDYVKPGHLYPDKVTPYGGVAVQAGTIPGTAPSAPFAPVVPPPTPVFPGGGAPVMVPNIPPPPGGPVPPPNFNFGG